VHEVGVYFARVDPKGLALERFLEIKKYIYSPPNSENKS
jgi:hypothetical protein